MDKSSAGAGFSPRTSVSPANLHSIMLSIIIFIITRGWHNSPGVASVPIVSQTKKQKTKKKKRSERSATTSGLLKYKIFVST
jgi:hypothetical protein